MRDRGDQIVLGTFLSTFVYCLLVLASPRSLLASAAMMSLCTMIEKTISSVPIWRVFIETYVLRRDSFREGLFGPSGSGPRPSVGSSACCQAVVRKAAYHPACRMNHCQGPSLSRHVCRQKIRPDPSRDGRSFSCCRLPLRDVLCGVFGGLLVGIFRHLLRPGRR